jgi:Na+/H+ antiporter NhaD/arsenite permease-like protein
MFSGLFMVVAGFDKAVIGPEAHELVARLNLGDVPILAGVTVALGNLAHRDRAPLVVAMAATLAGNLTLVASIANLIVAQKARSGGVTISCWAHFRIGLPVTLLSLVFGVYWLS